MLVSGSVRQWQGATDMTEPIGGAVLVVDDHGEVRRMIAELLRLEGYRVVAVPHGLAALDLLADGPQPALILFDLRMPFMDGWAFAEAYRSLSVQHAPLVVITALLDPQRESARIEPDAVVAKPFTVDELLEVVERFIGPSPNSSHEPVSPGQVITPGAGA